MTINQYYQIKITQKRTFKIISLAIWSYVVLTNYSIVAKQTDVDTNDGAIGIVSIAKEPLEGNDNTSSLLTTPVKIQLKSPSVPETPPSNDNPKISFYNSIIEEASLFHQIDPDLIRAIVMVESRYKPSSISRRKAKGLMQIMPKTAASLGVKNIHDPKENIFAGTKYFRYLLDRFNGDVELALASYNAGAKKVIQNDGIPPYKETHNFVENVFKYYAYYKIESLNEGRMTIDQAPM